ncbi:MAG: helix-turn-helix transcriptional regulator [Ruminococcaceae bacterium]|nr:helix-turn-helix transcriptional regulator [Oscillospiraceae bacterium]
MIRIKLSELLGKHKMTQKALADAAGIRPATVSKMYYEEVKRVEIEQLNRICKVFGCSIADLLEYVPDEQTSAE